MNYEELFAEAAGYEKDISNTMKAQLKQYKSLCSNIEKGDLKSAVKDLTPIEALCKNLEDSLSKMRDLVENFDSREYIEGGEFAGQMLECCKNAGVDAVGEGVLYEMFPYKVKIDVENLDLYIDRKKVQCFRPEAFVAQIKKGQDKLYKASFNAMNFVDELAEAYDLALLKKNKKPGSDCSLLTIYKFLMPMKRFRKDYDQQNFAFDIARLYSSDVECTGDGRRFQFSPGRDISKSIRILDLDGNENFFAVIRFYQ